MLCPACKTVNLAMTDRQGIEIDYCPSCRGIWLDRGELDRLIEKSDQAASRTPPPVHATPAHARHDDHRRGRDDHGHDDRHHGRKRHKSLLGELFDF
jgi:uncharacterized protein